MRKSVKSRTYDASTRRAAATAVLKAARADVRRHNMALAAPRMRRSFEKKNVDTQIASFIAAGGGAGTVTTINACQAGANPTSRVGRRIQLHSLYMRGEVRLSATTAGASPIRVLVVYDKQTNKAAPAAGDVLVSDNINALQLLANSHRFKVVADIVYPCVGTAGPQAIYIDEWRSLKGLETEYIDGAGAGTVADITSGGLFAITYQDAGLITAAPSSTLNFRVRFTDQ